MLDRDKERDLLAGVIGSHRHMIDLDPEVGHDTGGLQCECSWRSPGPAPDGGRPWEEIYLHVSEEILVSGWSFGVTA